MQNIAETLAQLRSSARPATSSRLVEWTGFGGNPGALEARIFIPADLAPGSALVVALHGCTQDAAAYDHGTGWSVLAQQEGFALLLPQQTRANNANLCFNWFDAADIGRTGGEAESIANMVGALIDTHHLDRARVFVTGLSAGGAMTAVMLATHPDLFAGGAIIGGLPYASAHGVTQALERMRGQGHASDGTATGAVTRVGPGAGNWPTVSLWHGTADMTVAHSNMAALGRQWRGVHGLTGEPTRVERGAGWDHRSWCGPDPRPLVEEWSVAGMGHGVPIDATDLGTVGPHMLDVGLSSTRRIAAGWGLLEAGGVAPAVKKVQHQPSPPAAPLLPAATAARPGRVQQIIEEALRSARLLP